MTSKTIIEGTRIICKGNLTGNYEPTPMELFNYIELELINRNDFVVYVKLLQFYNENLGYAYPTIPQLMIYTRIGGKSTIHNSLKTLEKVGLIYKGKAIGGNNVYVAFKPLDKKELYKLVPDRVKKLEADKAKLLKLVEFDKERFQQHKLLNGQ